MRTGNAANPRQAWYDRNPLVIALAYDSPNAPHAVTIRWAYTVPVNRKCNGEWVDAELFRVTAAGAVGQTSISNQYFVNGGGTSIFTQLDMIDNNVGARVAQNAGTNFVMLAGDQINSRTEDPSTGGTASFHTHLKATEYDA